LSALMAIEAHLDDWDAGEMNKPVRADPDAIEAVLREIEGRRSADLWLLKDGDEVTTTNDWLCVTSSNGLFSVGASMGKDIFVDLLGDASLEGEVKFAHGGQMTTWPRRFCVNVEDAIAVARHYVSTAELLEPSRWWVQGREGGS
jgi:hypothetical protein